MLEVDGFSVHVAGRRFALALRETVLSQTPRGGTLALRGASVSVDLSRSLVWPLATGVSLLGLAGAAGPSVRNWRKELRKRQRRPDVPQFHVEPGELRSDTPPTIELPPNARLVDMAVTLEFGLARVDSWVEGANGKITLDNGDADV